MDGHDDILKLGEVQRLGEERRSAELVGTVHLKYLLARGQDDCPQFREVRLLLNPFKHFKAVFAWHLQVEQQNTGERLLVSICETAFASEVRNRLLAIPDKLNGSLEANVFKGTP